MRDGSAPTLWLRRRVALALAVLALGGSVVLAHSAVTADHMGDMLAVCIAVVETAAAALLARKPAGFCTSAPAFGPAAMAGRGPLPGRRRPAPPPWPRGSPFALQVLRL